MNLLEIGDPFVIINQAILELLTTRVDVFVAEGRQIYAYLALIILTIFFIRAGLSRAGFDWDAFGMLIFFLTFGFTITEFYLTPIPWVGYSFKGLIVEESNYLANSIGGARAKEILAQTVALIPKIGLPHPFKVGGWILYILAVVGLVALTVAVYFVIAFSLVAQAVLILLGPVFCPFFIVPKLDTLFWSWFRCFLAYSFMQPVAQAFIFVFTTPILAFMKRYPLGWTPDQAPAAVPVLLIMLGLALLAIVKVPAFTNHIFSGMTGISFGILESGVEAAPGAAVIVVKSASAAAAA